MAGNDYRVGRAVLHCVVDRGLRERVGVAAAGAGLSVTAWVVGVLEDALGVGVVESGGVGADLGVAFAAVWDGRPRRVVGDVVGPDPLEEIA